MYYKMPKILWHAAGGQVLAAPAAREFWAPALVYFFVTGMLMRDLFVVAYLLVLYFCNRGTSFYTAR